MGHSSVDRVVQMLIDDYERQDNYLTKTQVERLQEKRGLNIDECVEVYRRLDELGVEVMGEKPQVKSAPESAPPDSLESHRPKSMFVGEIDGFGAFLNRSRTKLLTAKDEAELGRSMELGRRVHAEVPECRLNETHREILKRAYQARERMIKANIRLVVHNAMVFSGVSDLPFEDIVQEGLCGLMQGVERFDHNLGFRFSTYATHWIRQAIMRAIADRGSLIRLPAHIHEKLTKLRKADRYLRRLTPDREPTVKELADATDFPLDTVQYLLDLRNLVPASLDEPIKDSDGVTLGETLASHFESPDVQVEQLSLKEDVTRMLRELPYRHREVLELRFGLHEEGDGEGLTLQEVGEKFGLTRERIRQIETKALEKLKKGIRFNRRHPLRAYQND